MSNLHLPPPPPDGSSKISVQEVQLEKTTLTENRSFFGIPILNRQICLKLETQSLPAATVDDMTKHRQIAEAIPFGWIAMCIATLDLLRSLVG